MGIRRSHCPMCGAINEVNEADEPFCHVCHSTLYEQVQDERAWISPAERETPWREQSEAHRRIGSASRQGFVIREPTAQHLACG